GVPLRRRATSASATALDVDEPPRRAPPPSTSTSHPGELQRRGSDNSKKPSSHVAEGFRFRATCRSALHYGFVYVAVIHLDADALAAELAGDLLSHGDGAVTTTPAGNVNAGEHRLYLQGVHGDERADPVDAERDDTVRSRRGQDVVADHRVEPVPVAQLRVMVRVAQRVAQVDQQRVPISGRWSVQCPVGSDNNPDHRYFSFAT